MKYRFVQDGDCHWYLIPDELSGLFRMMHEDGEADYYCDFNNKFGGYQCDHPSSYTVENPE